MAVLTHPSKLKSGLILSLDRSGKNHVEELTFGGVKSFLELIHGYPFLEADFHFLIPVKKTSFLERHVATRLSYHGRGVATGGSHNSLIKDKSHVNSVVTLATNLYSTLVLEPAIVGCFLVIQD